MVLVVSRFIVRGLVCVALDLEEVKASWDSNDAKLLGESG